MKLRCDMSIILMAASLYVSGQEWTGKTYAVCGCECISVQSERLECEAREAKSKEEQTQKIKDEINKCQKELES